MGPVLPALVLALSLAADPWMEDCGLQPPGTVLAPPVAPKPWERPFARGEPAVVRRERGGTPRGFGLPASRTGGPGALAGKTVYLSAGHGFTWTTAVTPAAWLTQRGNTNGIVEDLVSTEAVHQFLVPMLLNAGARVVTARESDTQTNLAIIDDGTAGYVENGAGFTDSTVPGWGAQPTPITTDLNPFAQGKNRLVPAAPTVTASATYSTALAADGLYAVYVSYSAFDARVTDAHYVVTHAGGTSHFRVNQRRHGGTWILLGRFYFKAAAGPRVTLQNDSADTGNVSFDAVRLGGGMGLFNRGGGVSGRPRFEEASRYQVQFNGAPPSVFAASGTDRNDDISARSRFTAWDHEAGEDAAYLAWHTNAANATATGTETYVYGTNPPDGTYAFAGVAGSDRLAALVHAELINDLRAPAGWNQPAWRDRGVRSAFFGELNPSNNSEVPATLVEIAFHDTPADALHLKEPRFRLVAARALAQGLIRYFAERDAVAPRFPPDTPLQLSALAQGGGQVKVSWSPAPVDAMGVGGQAASGYLLYSSADGLGFDDGVPVSGTSVLVPLAAGEARYFRVAATNEGGESLPSGTVGARLPTPGAPTVLLVDAWDRFDSGQSRLEDLSRSTLGLVQRALLARMNDGSALARHGAAAAEVGVGFDAADSDAVAGGAVALNGYAAVVWAAGRGHAGGAGPTAAEQAVLTAFTATGKPLFFSGSEALRRLAASGAGGQAFATNVLRASASATSTSLSGSGEPGGALDALTWSLEDSVLDAPTPAFLDAVAGASGTSPLSRYATSGTSGVLEPRKAVTFGFPFERIVGASARREVLGRALQELGVIGAVPPPPDGGSGGGAGGGSGGGGGGGGDPAPIRLGRLPTALGPEPRGCGCATAEGLGGCAVAAWALARRRGLALARRRP